MRLRLRRDKHGGDLQNVARGQGGTWSGVEQAVVYLGAPRALARDLERRLGPGNLSAAPPRKERRVELDTIELGLERSGARLTWEPRSKKSGLLEWTGADGRGAQLELRAPPAFVSDLEPGPLRQALRKTAGLRRLIELREVDRSERELRRLDERGKTVARVVERRERFRRPGSGASWSAARSTLVALPVRGFEAEHGELVAALADVRGLARANGTAHERPAPGLPFRFEPLEAWPRLERGRPAAGALRAIALRQLQIVQAQEPGLRADLDTEFNHDLRVAVRRARAMLSQLARAVAPGEVTYLREQLAWLGSVTGPVRDLDVLLLEMRQLEVELREPLATLAELVEERRASEREALIEALDAPRWVEVQALWQGWAESAGCEIAPELGELVASRIERLLRRVQREGALLGVHAPPDALHGLRIECKKLRYLLECAARIVDPGQHAQCVSALRGLQEVLGAVNDARLQAERLEAWAKPLAKRDPRSLLALGRWIERRRTAERSARTRFAARLAALAGRDTQRSFEGLCAQVRSSELAP